MTKEVTKENLKNYCEEHLEGTATMVAAGMISKEKALGHAMELFYLSATFGLGLQDKAREMSNEFKK